MDEIRGKVVSIKDIRAKWGVEKKGGRKEHRCWKHQVCLSQRNGTLLSFADLQSPGGDAETGDRPALREQRLHKQTMCRPAVGNKTTVSGRTDKVLVTDPQKEPAQDRMEVSAGEFPQT